MNEMTERVFKIWSIEHHSWWRPHRMGYTTELDQAGYYVESEAREIVNQANSYGLLNECMIPVDSLR